MCRHYNPVTLFSFIKFMHYWMCSVLSCSNTNGPRLCSTCLCFRTHCVVRENFLAIKYPA